MKHLGTDKVTPIPKSKIHFVGKQEKKYDPMEWDEFFDEEFMF